MQYVPVAVRLSQTICLKLPQVQPPSVCAQCTLIACLQGELSGSHTSHAGSTVPSPDLLWPANPTKSPVQGPRRAQHSPAIALLLHRVTAESNPDSLTAYTGHGSGSAASFACATLAQSRPPPVRCRNLSATV